MQADNKGNEVKAVILLEIPNVFMHRLLNKEKTLFTSGTCKIAKLQNNGNNPVYFINLGSFYYGIHPDIYFIKVAYQDTFAYVFPHFENGLSAISLLHNAPQIHSLDEILSNAAKLLDITAADARPDIKNAIDMHYPLLEKEQIYYPDNIKKVITTSGRFFNTAFTFIGGLMKTGIEKTGNYLNSKIEEGQPTQIKPETKEKWQSLKHGTNNFIKVSTDFALKFLEPVIQKTKEYTTDIKQKIDSSQNESVKYAKELATVSGKALEQAFDGFVKGGTEITKQFSEQSKKLITKKYGQDVVRTISGEEGIIEKKQHQKPAEHTEEGKLHAPKQQQHSQVRLLENSMESLNYPTLEK